MTTTLARRAGVLALVAATTTALTGCAGVFGAQMTYNDVEKTKITEIRLTGSSGDVVVKTGTSAETSIKRVIRRNSNPDESYKLDGSALLLDTSCGTDCTVSYEIVAPAGVAVRGELDSGDIHLTGVGTTDLRLSSGDLSLVDATGPATLRADSGDINVTGAKAAVKAQLSSGDLRVIEAAGPLNLTADSGDIDASITAPASVVARVSSGDINLIVPAGSYRATAEASSGDAAIGSIVNDPASKHVLDIHADSGDAMIVTSATLGD